MMDSRQEKMERRGWFDRLHLSWPMLFLVGWLLYELTAQPGLGALVACAKFGSTDTSTAFWLRRVDPDRRRGQTCFWCYLAFGLWKVGMMASLAMIVMGFVGGVVLDRAPRQPQPISPLVGGVLAAAAVGFSLFFPAACIALWSAWRNSVRIWLGHAPNRARKERFWPPRHGWINMASLVSCTIILMVVCVIILLDVVLIMIAHANGAPRIILALQFLAIFPTALAGLGIAIMVEDHLFARSPQECWNVEEDEAVYQIHDTEEEMSNA